MRRTKKWKRFEKLIKVCKKLNNKIIKEENEGQKDSSEFVYLINCDN
jgi:hypothetical protein